MQERTRQPLNGTNISGATNSTLALTNATFPYALLLANKGWKQALRDNAALRKGLNIVEGKVTYPGVAEAFGMPLSDPDSFLN